jgi:hypothetical protein
MTSDEHLLMLVRQALDDFETAELPASCRRAFRIAHLLGHSKDSWFLRMDLRPRWLVFYGCFAGRGDRLEASERVTRVAVTREFVGLL